MSCLPPIWGSVDRKTGQISLSGARSAFADPVLRRTAVGRSPIAFSGASASTIDGGGTFENMAKSFLAGGFSGALAKTVIAPLDRLKIIFQISHMEFSFSAVARELQRTVSSEGFRALFRGNLAQVLRVYPYSGVQLMTYDRYAAAMVRFRGGSHSHISRSAHASSSMSPGAAAGAAVATVAPGSSGGSHYKRTADKARLTGVEKMLCGAAAGATSVIATYPLDLMRARLAVQMERPPPEALAANARAAAAAAEQAATAAARAAARLAAVTAGGSAGLAAQEAAAAAHASAAATAEAAAAAAAAAAKAVVAAAADAAAASSAAAAAAAAAASGAPAPAPPAGSGAAAAGAANKPATYRSMGHAFASMYREHGARSFYRGMAPTLLGILPYAGLAFFVFESAKQLYSDTHGGAEPTGVHKLVFGGVAGLVGQVSTYPLDIVRRRMQTEGFSPIHAHLVTGPGGHGPSGTSAAGLAAQRVRPPPPTLPPLLQNILPAKVAELLAPGRGGMTDTALRIVRRQGIRGLFKGLSLNFVKGPVAVGVSFSTFDLLKRTFDIE